MRGLGAAMKKMMIVAALAFVVHASATLAQTPTAPDAKTISKQQKAQAKAARAEKLPECRKQAREQHVQVRDRHKFLKRCLG